MEGNEKEWTLKNKISKVVTRKRTKEDIQIEKDKIERAMRRRIEFMKINPQPISKRHTVNGIGFFVIMKFKMKIAFEAMVRGQTVVEFIKVSLTSIELEH